MPLRQPQAAEGATRSETLRQTDCETGLTLESDRLSDPPKGCGSTQTIQVCVKPDLSGNRTEGRQVFVNACRPFFVAVPKPGNGNPAL
jgi:hypothetical protein